MKTILWNVLAVIVGFVVGNVLNMSLIILGMWLIPLPPGADMSTPAGMREAMKLLTPAHFVFPFLGHALGTLVGAFLAAKIAASHPMKFALGIGVFFLFAGLLMVIMGGGPLWFIAADLLLAYLPMAYLGGIVARPKATDPLPVISP